MSAKHDRASKLGGSAPKACATLDQDLTFLEQVWQAPGELDSWPLQALAKFWGSSNQEGAALCLGLP